MKTEDLIAINIHTHAEVSCWNPFDNYGEEYDRAADKYFGSNLRPTIDETVAHYLQKKIGLVDSVNQHGRVRQHAAQRPHAVWQRLPADHA